MKNKFKIPSTFNQLLAEEIGLHLGDGSMNYYKNKGFYQLRGHIVDDRSHYDLHIKNIYKELFNSEIKLREMSSTGVYGFQIWSNAMVDYKSKFLELPLGKKIDFSIPLEIRKDKELSKCFLRGYFDTDGCLYLEKKNGYFYPRIEMASISERFIVQLKEILTNLNFQFSYYIEDRSKYNWQNLHRIILRGNIMANKWFSEIKPANFKHIEKFNKLT